MKKFLIYVIAMVLIVASAGTVFAHPPKNASIAWDKALETLTVTADHNVNDPAKHYVLTLTVFEGNKQLLLKQYDKQNSPVGFSDSVMLQGLKSGSVVRVQLVCNIMGSTEAEIKIP
jgi:hypothetical protein